MKPKWLQRRRAAALLARADREASPSNLEALDRFGASGAGANAVLQSASRTYRQSARLSRSTIAAADRTAAPTGRARRNLAVAASLATGVICAGAIYAALEVASRPINAVLLTTKVGEIREVPLEDGSKVILDTQSAVRVEVAGSHRSALVERGRARFSVARKKVPFTIRTASASLSLDEGIVDIDAGDQQPSIQVIAGTAKVRPQATAGTSDVTLRAPEAVSTAGGAVHQSAGNQDPNWPSGRLTFTGTRLADVVAAANRYSDRKIVLADGVIAELRVTGVFRAGDPDGLAASLAAALGLQFEHRGKNYLLMQVANKKTGG